jgi:isocitrate dehydrogenase
VKREIAKFEGPGVIQGMHNINRSIEAFAIACLNTPLTSGRTCGSARRTPYQDIRRKFRDIFDRLYNEKYSERFKNRGKLFLHFNRRAVSRVIRSEGGIIWACKNYDGML